MIFLKLGGSLITDKRRRETPRMDVIRRLAQEIAAARQTRPDLRLLVGHGSGSFGHFAGREYGTRRGIRPGEEARGWYGFAATGAAAARLNRLVTDALVEAGLPAVSFPPSATARCRAGQLQELAWEPLARALDAGLLPVIHGDVAFDDQWGCTIVSTEELFAYLTPILRPTRILLAGTVDGVFTADPLVHPQAALLAEIHASQLDALEAELGSSYGVDVTGGMWSKVRIMAELVRRHPGLEVHIFSGEHPGALRACLLSPAECAGTRLRW
ncbi:MAG: isopentenyl phosphate kinase family protein [Anaerolineae bacterium]|nr:isopentenyl phosphate kinase family protein [Anaerolineae bacterium]